LQKDKIQQYEITLSQQNNNSILDEYLEKIHYLEELTFKLNKLNHHKDQKILELENLKNST
jgi:hypothetical protein